MELTKANSIVTNDHERMVYEQNIPYELSIRPQWVCWRYIDRGEGRKPDKQPVNPHNLHNAGATWPNTWADFETTLKAYQDNKDGLLHGMGFVLTLDDPLSQSIWTTVLTGLTSTNMRQR